MSCIIKIANLNKIYAGGFQALKNINLEIQKGEIFALLGPNGAGKTTLISTICGITRPTSGSISVSGHDIIKDYRKARSYIGLVPQELTTDAFELVTQTVQFSRGLFGKKRDPQVIEDILKSLSLWEKRNNKLMTLSGGMKRRVMIAKALAHQPRVLFLDEPTAGVDVELRKGMWQQVRKLRDDGVTVILTTHYIEEAEEMADRIGIINHGELILTEQKEQLLKNLGTKKLSITVDRSAEDITQIKEYPSTVITGSCITHTYDEKRGDTGLDPLFCLIKDNGFVIKDVNTKQSSLEEIFVSLVKK